MNVERIKLAALFGACAALTAVYWTTALWWDDVSGVTVLLAALAVAAVSAVVAYMVLTVRDTRENGTARRAYDNSRRLGYIPTSAVRAASRRAG